MIGDALRKRWSRQQGLFHGKEPSLPHGRDGPAELVVGLLLCLGRNVGTISSGECSPSDGARGASVGVDGRRHRHGIGGERGGYLRMRRRPVKTGRWLLLHAQSGLGPRMPPERVSPAQSIAYGGWVGDGFIPRRGYAVVRLSVDEMAKDLLGRGKDGRVGRFGRLKRHLHPVLAAVCLVDFDALFGS